VSGTPAGGRAAYETNIRIQGPDFYKRIGALGGARSVNGGFDSKTVGKDGLTGKERARTAGAKGGRLSRRQKAA
jgi:general stress protein YciG